jgi:hypothetical protein
MPARPRSHRINRAGKQRVNRPHKPRVSRHEEAPCQAAYEESRFRHGNRASRYAAQGMPLGLSAKPGYRRRYAAKPKTYWTAFFQTNIAPGVTNLTQ